MESALPERACDKCRQRRVKCDKTRPNCLRCQKIGKPCPGYERPLFFDESDNLRRKFLEKSSKDQTRRKPSEAAWQSPMMQAGSPLPGIAASPASQVTQSSRRALSINSLTDNATSITTPPDFSEPLLSTTYRHQLGKAVSSQSPSLRGSSLHHEGTPRSQPQVHGYHDSIPQKSEPYIEESLISTPNIDENFFDLDLTTYYESNGNSCGFLPNVPYVVDGSNQNGIQQFSADDVASIHTEEAEQEAARLNDLHLRTANEALLDDREHEMALLIRHFAENIGPWMDLFDIGRYYAHIVPLKAQASKLLRYVLAAISAKHLGRLTVLSHQGLQEVSRQRSHLDYLSGSTDWFYKAANYYDKAISYLRIYLEVLSSETNEKAFADDSTTGIDTASDNKRRLSDADFARPFKKPRLSRSSSSPANREDLLSAVSLLSLYEFLDGFEKEWDQHLNGFQSLLVAHVRPQLSETIWSTASPSHSSFLPRGKCAALWNFAWADLIAAYTNNTKTRLDTEDYVLWRGAGLQIGEQGTLHLGSHQSNQAEASLSASEEELTLRTVLWILLRIVNYLAEQTERNTEPSPSALTGLISGSSPGTAASALSQQARWEELNAHLTSWHQNLPDTFRPCTKVCHEDNPRERHQPGKSFLMELFFSIPMCAAAFQFYHFGRILLLLNKPASSQQTGGGTGERLKEFRKVLEQVNRHCREICAIALGRPEPAVRIQMVQPLYLAGLCLEDDEDKKTVLQLLRSIESDTGCSTLHRTQDLLSHWGWDNG